MYTIDHAERAFQARAQTEPSLKRYKIDVLKKLCVNRGIQVDAKRHLKAPYIHALLNYVSYTHRRSSSSIDKRG